MYMITSSGSFYEGVVKCAYFQKNGRLFDEERAVDLGPMDSFEVVAVVGGREEEAFEGLPTS